MRRYHIKIFLSNQNLIDARAEADSLENAVDKVITTEQAEELLYYNRIESIQLIDTKEIRPIEHRPFLLQESSAPGYWVVTDLQKGIVCKFLERGYKKDHIITNINDTPTTDPLTGHRTPRDGRLSHSQTSRTHLLTFIV